MTDRERILEEIENLVAENKIMIFMKGEKDFPVCGFSARVVDLFKMLGYPFRTANVLSHPDYLDYLEEYSHWPTSPQVFVDGELIGGCDIAFEMYETGELQKRLEGVFAGSKA